MSDSTGTSVPPAYLTAPVVAAPLPAVPDLSVPVVVVAPVIAKPVAKVAAAGISGAALVILVAILGGIAPNTFDSLGVWGPVVAAAITAFAAFAAGYIKKA